jgi:hypothetical protein
MAGMMIWPDFPLWLPSCRCAIRAASSAAVSGDPGSASPSDRWFLAFERGVKDMFADRFGEVDWSYRVDRDGPTVTAGDLLGGRSVTVQIPSDYLDRNAWLLAGDLLTRLRQMAEELDHSKPRP